MDVRAEIRPPGKGGGRSQRAVTEILFTVAESSLGRVLVARTDRGLCAVMLGDDDIALERDLRHRLPRAQVRAGGAEMNALAAEVVALVESPARALNVPLDLQGTEFQRRVWEVLMEIPAGETMSYTGIANRIGRPRSERAVGQACGANALAVVIPCHRAVRSDGGLSGYRWGVERKRELLRKELA